MTQSFARGGDIAHPSQTGSRSDRAAGRTVMPHEQTKAGGLAWFAHGSDWQGMSFSHLPEHRRFDAFQAAYKGHFDFAQVADVPFDFHYRARQTGPIAVSECHSPPTRTKLKPANCRPTDPDVLFLAMYTRGTVNGICGDQKVAGKGGEIHAVDLSRDLTVRMDGVHQIAAYIPHRLIGFDASRHRAHGSVAMTAGGGRILAAAFGVFLEPSEDTRDDNETADAFLAVVRSVVLGRVEDEHAGRAVERARRAALRNFIETRLTDPELSADDVCRAFCASRATIYRDFAEDGGIRNYIQARRLEHVRRTLAATPPQRGAIVRIAERFGFVSQAHFNRAFRAAYGTNPSAVLGSEA